MFDEYHGWEFWLPGLPFAVFAAYMLFSVLSHKPRRGPAATRIADAVDYETFQIGSKE